MERRNTNPAELQKQQKSSSSGQIYMINESINQSTERNPNTFLSCSQSSPVSSARVFLNRKITFMNHENENDTIKSSFFVLSLSCKLSALHARPNTRSYDRLIDWKCLFDFVLLIAQPAQLIKIWISPFHFFSENRILQSQQYFIIRSCRVVVESWWISIQRNHNKLAGMSGLCPLTIP